MDGELMPVIYSSDPNDYAPDVAWDDDRECYYLVDSGEEFDINCEAECFSENFDETFSKAPGFVVMGRLGLWNSNPRVATVLTNLSGASDFLGRFLLRSECEIRVASETVDYGNLAVFVTHHDGVNTFRVRELTPRGLTYYNNHRNDDDEYAVCEHIFDSNVLSREVRI